MQLRKMYTDKRVLLFVIVTSIVFGALIGAKLFLSYYATDKSAQVALARQYIGIAEDIVKGLDKREYQKFLDTPQDEARRQNIKLFLEQYRLRINAHYVYTLLFDDTDISRVGVSANPPGYEDVWIGAICTLPSAQVRQAKSGHSYYSDIIQGEYGDYYLSVGVPLYDKTGRMLGALGIDIEAKDLANVSHQVVRGNSFIFFIDIIFALALLAAVFFLYKWYRVRLSRSLQEAENLYTSELGKVVDTIKSGRHDLMNHLQVISGLMQIKMYDKAWDYLKQLSVDVKVMDWTLRIKNPILMVLFQSKWELAQTRNIQMDFDTDQEDYRRVESMDLVKIYANLLDNAIEALDGYDGDQPRCIRVTCKTMGEKYIFAVENPALLTAKEQKAFFQHGYSTKDQAHAARGNGLMIVKKTVTKYKGALLFKYEDEKVLIQITI
ncbi:histidine kinase [Paenibacillus selenitireducens]|uniref:Histidine kinase n=1 Tax=Paenibacillus selenitireducens TaxID=1324314 RepID=A0A1T2XHB8_9BACL|nr:GHKL domain-containing protein [Paenibacillus selenitireducens]OPA79274.1 histidine kinase [Paenibacillus selenitireducens]